MQCREAISMVKEYVLPDSSTYPRAFGCLS